MGGDNALVHLYNIIIMDALGWSWLCIMVESYLGLSLVRVSSLQIP